MLNYVSINFILISHDVSHVMFLLIVWCYVQKVLELEKLGKEGPLDCMCDLPASIAVYTAGLGL